MRLTFEFAAQVFYDPLALTILDDDHHGKEERWITLGEVNGRKLIVVVHTWQETDTTTRVRRISARYATRHEECQYHGGN